LARRCAQVCRAPCMITARESRACVRSRRQTRRRDRRLR
jgi:hypothetical protein